MYWYVTQFNLTPVICLHTVKWLNSFILPIDGTLIGTTTSSQSGPGNNDNEEILHIPQSSSLIRAPPSNSLVSYPGHLFESGLTPLMGGGNT